MANTHGKFDYATQQFWCNACQRWISKEKVDDKGHEHFTKETIYFDETPLKYAPYTHITKQEVIKDHDKFVTSCGATSSKLNLRMDLVPETFIRRIAQRYTLGAEKHGEYNYRKGLTDSKYLQERIAHMKMHLSDLLMGYNKDDDNLAAIGWCVAFLMEAEQMPDGKAALQQAIATMNYQEPMGGITKKEEIIDLKDRAI